MLGESVVNALNVVWQGGNVKAFRGNDNGGALGTLPLAFVAAAVGTASSGVDTDFMAAVFGVAVVHGGVCFGVVLESVLGKRGLLSLEGFVACVVHLCIIPIMISKCF